MILVQRRDVIRSSKKGLADPSNVNSLLKFLEAHPSHAEAITWTLNQDLSPIYAILPSGPFASEVYGKLRCAGSAER